MPPHKAPFKNVLFRLFHIVSGGFVIALFWLVIFYQINKVLLEKDILPGEITQPITLMLVLIIATRQTIKDNQISQIMDKEKGIHFSESQEKFLAQFSLIGTPIVLILIGILNL